MQRLGIAEFSCKWTRARWCDIITRKLTSSNYFEAPRTSNARPHLKIINKAPPTPGDSNEFARALVRYPHAGRSWFSWYYTCCLCITSTAQLSKQSAWLIHLIGDEAPPATRDHSGVYKRINKLSSCRKRRAQLEFKQQPNIANTIVNPGGCLVRTTGDSLPCARYLLVLLTATRARSLCYSVQHPFYLCGVHGFQYQALNGRLLGFYHWACSLVKRENFEHLYKSRQLLDCLFACLNIEAICSPR